MRIVRNHAIFLGGCFASSEGWKCGGECEVCPACAPFAASPSQTTEGIIRAVRETHRDLHGSPRPVSSRATASRPRMEARGAVHEHGPCLRLAMAH